MYMYSTNSNTILVFNTAVDINADSLLCLYNDKLMIDFHCSIIHGRTLDEKGTKVHEINLHTWRLVQ
jgi:hypothetical protein